MYGWKILLMEEIRRENQLRLVVYPVIYKVLYISSVQDFFHQQYDPFLLEWPIFSVFVAFWLGKLEFCCILLPRVVEDSFIFTSVKERLT